MSEPETIVGADPWKRSEMLRAALIEARRAIKALHGPIAWDIYEKHSPEMKQIDAALEKAKT